MSHICRCPLCDPGLADAIQPAPGVYGIGPNYNQVITHEGKPVLTHRFQATLHGEALRWVFAVKPGEWAAHYTPDENDSRHACCRDDENKQVSVCTGIIYGDIELHPRVVAQGA